MEDLAPLRFACGVAVRALPGETSCGDVHVLKRVSRGWLLAAMDGLGHGPDAAHGARMAAAILEAHSEEPPAKPPSIPPQSSNRREHTVE